MKFSKPRRVAPRVPAACPRQFNHTTPAGAPSPELARSNPTRRLSHYRERSSDQPQLAGYSWS